MFHPETFYNAANAIFVLRDFRRMFEKLDYAPRVMIISIDYFTFLPKFEFIYRLQSKDDMGGLGSPEQIRIIEGVFDEAARNPKVLLPTRDDDGVTAIGLSAIKSGTGFRLDGSYHYGRVPQLRDDSAVAAIQAGTQWPILPASHLDDNLLREFERFTDLARQKGIALVGVTMPLVPPVLNAIEESPLYPAWRQFESAPTRQWIERQGVIYFDFTRLDSFAGKADEFVDPFHPSEPAYIRMLLTMLREPAFRALFPKLDPSVLEARLKQATPFEAYRNEF
jgi:hypothetical protein